VGCGSRRCSDPVTPGPRIMRAELAKTSRETGIAKCTLGVRKCMALRYCLPFGIFVCVFLFLITTIDRFVNPFDEGLILVGSTRVLSGDIPYRDFYAIYGPAQFYVLAALFKLFGPSVLVERLWDLVIRSCTVLIVYLIVDHGWSRWRALSAAVLTCLWLSYFGTYGYPVFPCLLFSLISLYCLVPVYNGSRAVAPLLAAGLCVGIAILFRHDIGIVTAAGGACMFGMFHLTRQIEPRQKTRALLRSAAIYTGGIALALVPPLAFLVAAGAARDMFLDLVLIPARIYVPMRSLPFPSLVEIARGVLHRRIGSLDQLAIYLPILAVLLGIIAALALSANQRSATSIAEKALILRRRWILAQLSVFSLLFFFKGWVRVSLIHMALSIVPSLVIMTVWELRSRAARILFTVGIACLLLVSLPPMRNALWRFEQNRTWAAQSSGIFAMTPSDSGSCFPPSGLERLRCFYVFPNQVAAIRYVQERTSENEAICRPEPAR
jgi:dolichyl-phosphate-mannose-protein mannosyltransferase